MPTALHTLPTLPPPAELGRFFALQGFSYADRTSLLPCLSSAFTQCGGWVLERRTTSPATMEFRLELQLRAVVDLYAALVANGVELTRTAHATLTGLCTCRRHSARGGTMNEVLTFQLELHFLEDVTLHSLLSTGSGLA